MAFIAGIPYPDADFPSLSRVEYIYLYIYIYDMHFMASFHAANFKALYKIALKHI